MRKDLREKGFTLVELAIVMVIIGLLIGAVLKGQAMIDDARGKRLLNDMQGISAAYFTYMDRYSAVPGDDTTLHGWAGVVAGNGDSLIDGTGTTEGNEDNEVWQALRYAGLLTGDPAAATASMLPNNPFGGAYTLGNVDFGAGIGTKNHVAAANVPRVLAELFDIKHDDGVWNTGTVQADGDYSAPAVVTVNLQYAL